MSTINKKPFIKTLVEDMTAGQIATLQLLVDGGGNQNAILRTMNIKPVGNRTHITVGDKGIHLCDLEVNFSLFKGYLIYTDHYCVLIHFTDSQVLGMFKIDLNDLTKFETVSEELSVLELRNELNDTRESEDADVIETVNEGIANGDIVVPTYKTFPSTWNVNGTTKAFCDSVAADLSAVEGMAYLGEVYFSDMPGSIVNSEIVVEIMTGTTAASKVIKLTLTSGNVKPYHWEYTYWNNGSNVSGWKGLGMSVVELNSMSGTLTDEQYDILNGDNGIIKYGDYFYYKEFYGPDYNALIAYSKPHSFYVTGEKYERFEISRSTKDYNFISSDVMPKVLINPTLDGTEAELLGLQVGDIKCRVPAVSKTDGVTFTFADNADYSLSAVANYASYVRIVGTAMIFVASFNITKNNAATTPITVGKFENIPNDMFAKLVGGTFLDEANTKAFIDGSFSDSVDAATALVKGVNNDVAIQLQTENLVVGTMYHVRHMSMFLLTDNLSGIDTVLSNNSWSVIDEVAKSGLTSNYWSVGDTKTDLGTDGTTRTFRIVEIEADGSIVFEQVELENSAQWNPDTNLDSDNAYNDYYISDMRNTHLPATLLKYSSALQNVITTTNVKVATNGSNGTILTLTDKLFLEAEKEVWTSRSYSRTEEFNDLSTFAYWTTHTTNVDHIKYQNGSADHWWLRSPYSGYTNFVCYVNSGGVAGNGNANGTRRFSPCFRIGTAQTGGLGPYIPVSSTLNDNSWDTIKSVCEAGDAANYWAVGDTKTDVGADGYTRSFRIVDMSGLYNKHVVFEQVGLEGTDGTGATGVVWDADNLNDYSASDMNVTVLPGVVLRYSSELQQSLTNTTVKVAENGNSSTIVDVTNKLFLEAEKEVGYISYSRTEEQAVLTTYSYWATHTSASDHVKYNQANSAYIWWLRSPCSGDANYVCLVNNNGNANYVNAYGTYRFAPCFSF